MGTSGSRSKEGFPVRAPEYFPGIPFFAHALKNGGIVLNTGLQYSRQSFQNRCRIRKPDGAQWLTVPLQGGQFGSPIGSTVIDNRTDWAKKHLKALRFNYGSATYYPYYIDAIRELLLGKWSTLGDLTCRTIVLLNDLLDARLSIAIDTTKGTGETEGEGSTEPEGIEEPIPDREEAHALHSRIPRTPRIAEYPQNFDGFIPGLSVLDLLFNCGPESGTVIRSVSG